MEYYYYHYPILLLPLLPSNPQVDDALLLRLAVAAARGECAALRTAALRAPMLAAPTAVLYGGKGAPRASSHRILSAIPIHPRAHPPVSIHPSYQCLVLSTPMAM